MNKGQRLTSRGTITEKRKNSSNSSCPSFTSVRTDIQVRCKCALNRSGYRKGSGDASIGGTGETVEVSQPHL
jgi:hypothetical protein